MALPHLYLPAESADGDDERARLQDLHRLLDQSATAPVRVVTTSGQEVPLPPLVQQLLADAVQTLSDGEALSLVPLHQSLTIEDAAALLQAPPQHVVRLIDRGLVPASGEGDERRILYADLLAYQRARRGREEAGLREIVRISEDLGLYDE
jgi:excisionase family DNA binding protein